MRKTIANIETRASGRLTSSDEIIIFPGATNAIFSVLTCLLDGDDELIVTEPAYVGYRGIFQAIGANIISVPANIEAGFTLDSDAIERAMSSKTKMLLLNTPGNPAGNMILADQLASLAR